MKFSLSRDARLLLLRAFFLVMAAGLIYGIYDNRVFLTHFPFNILAVLDILFIGAFAYFAHSLASIVRHKKALLWYTVTVFWAYTTLVSLASSAYHAYNLGVENVALVAGKTTTMYIVSEIVYLALLPGLAFAVILWFLRKV